MKEFFNKNKILISIIVAVTLLVVARSILDVDRGQQILGEKSKEEIFACQSADKQPRKREAFFPTKITFGFIANISEIIYKAFFEEKLEIEKLKQEVELSKIKEQRAEKETQEEIIKRIGEEIARKEAEQQTKEETAKRIQEETARKSAEEKARQEEEAKRLAEQRAVQEEAARKIKEEELSEKEAEEQRLNADNDGDGLTLREEQKKGTSDLNRDSDYDGIDDSEDTNPVGGGEDKPQYFEWEYKGRVWTLIYPIHEDWYNYYNNKPRSSHGVEYITSDDPFIQEVSKTLKDTAEKEGYHLSSFIISFVQGLPYVADFYTSVTDLPKYPVETFIDRNGDCEDFSYLSASLVRATGIGVALIEFDDHMAVGIKTVPQQHGRYYEIDGGRYYYFETTGEGWVLGEMPSEYYYEQAKLTRAWDGKVVWDYPKYERPCDPSSEFSGYYYDGNDFYSDSNCYYQITCLPLSDYYFSTIDENLYHDNGCSQIVVEGCYKSTDYLRYFYDGVDYYSDSLCTQKARICRPSPFYSDEYWDGEDSYWDSICTQKVVSWCAKSTYHPGYFFSSLDNEYYYDYQCTQKAELF